MSEIFVRVYTPTAKRGNGLRFEETHNKDIMLIFDTETTSNRYQNLTFGSCIVKVKGENPKRYLFYSEDLPQKDLETIRGVAESERLKGRPIDVVSRSEFVENVFYKYAYFAAAEIVGFNLPFDISRLAVNYRSSGDSFIFVLSDKYPPISITHIDQTRAFISFTKGYRGYFVDLRTLTFALTNQKLDLKKACEAFGVKHGKYKVKEHGRITRKYVKYNLRDTLATAELYDAALDRYRLLGLSEDANKLYSPASIGKAYLRAMGVKPFLAQNPSFDPYILGYAMSAYYGGRVECRVKADHVKVTDLDFTSMYPSVYCLLGLDAYLKAERIEYFENTDNVKRFIEEITLESLSEKPTWLRDEMHSIVQVLPDHDVLPIRSEYASTSHDTNIALNYVSSDKPLWYSVLDVVGSKILTGKTPKVLKAITFRPIGRQSLKPIRIMDIEISPDEDFFRELIDKRQNVKDKLKSAVGHDRDVLDQLQLILKIIANSSGYGIFVEETPKKQADKVVVDVYSDIHFKAEVSKIEELGEYFNPIMAVLITSAARLILAMAESLVGRLGGYIAYMDTDSVMVDPKVSEQVKLLFSNLNPYTHKVDMFKEEEDKQGDKLIDVWFYGLSAKRYCLYRVVDGRIAIAKCSLHGLGQYVVGDRRSFAEKFWLAAMADDSEHLEEFKGVLAAKKLAVNTPNILAKIRKINEDKPLSQSVKPFGFALVGLEVKGVIPLIPYTTDLRGIDELVFVDCKSGKTSEELGLEPSEYWRNMEYVYYKFTMHADTKYDYTPQGVFVRKHVHVVKIRHIGKETNKIEEAEILGVDRPIAEYFDKESDIKGFEEFVLSVKPRQALEYGISDRQLKRIKSKIRMGGEFKYNGKAYKALFAKYREIKGIR